MTDHLHDKSERLRVMYRVTRSHGSDADAAPHPLLALNAQVGNAQVARMLAQREGAPEDEEDQIQAKPEVGLEGGPISAGLAGQINAKRGGGAALDSGTRASMEGAFGTSFADVRVHTDAASDALNRSISAKAFTTGSDIFFRQDTSPSDHGLLAHELTHVVQQRSGGGGGEMTIGPAGDSHEQQADSVAAAVTSGSAAQAQRDADAAQTQRMPAQRAGELEEEAPTE